MERGGYYAAPYNPETDPWHEGEDDPHQAQPLPAQITAADLMLPPPPSNLPRSWPCCPAGRDPPAELLAWFCPAPALGR